MLNPEDVAAAFGLEVALVVVAVEEVALLVGNMEVVDATLLPDVVVEVSGPAAFVRLK